MLLLNPIPQSKASNVVRSDRQKEDLPSPAARWGRVERILTPREAGPIWDDRLTRERPEGVVDVVYARRGSKTVARHVYREGSTRFSQSLSSAGPDVAYNMIVQTGGGLVEGERYLARFTLLPHTHAVVATQAPTCVFKCEHGRVTVQRTAIELKEDATFEFYQDPLIPYEHSRLRQETRIELARGASCLVFDGITSGWSADDTPFRYSDAFFSTEIRRDGSLVLLDRLLLEPFSNELSGLGYFEGFTNLDSALLVDERITTVFIDSVRARLNAFCAARGLDESTLRWAISALDGGGCVMRILGKSAALNREVALVFSNHWREERGFAPLALRRNDTRRYGG